MQYCLFTQSVDLREKSGGNFHGKASNRHCLKPKSCAARVAKTAKTLQQKENKQNNQ